VGADSYLCSASSEAILRVRLGKKSKIESMPFSQKRQIGSVFVSFHPAGHILGSAQVRIEGKDEVCVVTGDHNISHTHSASEVYEPVKCDTFITECTFGLPIYQWPSQEEVYRDILDWWKLNQELGNTCIIPTYPLGKTHRLLAGLKGSEIGEIGLYGAGKDFLSIYEKAGVGLAECRVIRGDEWKHFEKGGLILMSSGGNDPTWLDRLNGVSTASVSGWMQTRGARRGRNMDRGFVLSDHSDWEGLLAAVKLSGASKVGVMHGEIAAFGRYLEEKMKVEVWRVGNTWGNSRAD
jgi:putative mRNA 3-end processing factor